MGGRLWRGLLTVGVVVWRGRNATGGMTGSGRVEEPGGRRRGGTPPGLETKERKRR